MKKIAVIMTLCVLLAGVFTGPAMAEKSEFQIDAQGSGPGGAPGPAPNSGDGVPDGSGLDSPNGPNGK
jgi:hypothetical protein